MSTVLDVYGGQTVALEKEPARQARSDAVFSAASSNRHLYHGQVRSLIQQLFFREENTTTRHVGIAAIDDSTEIAELSFEIARTVAEESRYDIGLIDASPGPARLENQLTLAMPTMADSGWSIAPHRDDSRVE